MAFNRIKKSVARMFCDDRAQGCAVLMYHRIFEPAVDSQLLSVSLENFESHLIFLKQNYEIISSQTLVDRLREGNIKDQSICITFDDGYFDNYLNAFPLLKHHQIPATIFVSTANIGTNQEYWWDELENIFLSSNEKYSDWNALSTYRDSNISRYLNLQETFKSLNLEDRCKILNHHKTKDYKPRENYRSMNHEELSEITTSGIVEIGAHTKNHYSLGRIDRFLAITEIQSSTNKIREINKKENVFFSYPFGGPTDCRKDLRQVFDQENIPAAFVNQFGICSNETSLKAIPRIIARNQQVDEFSIFINNLWH
ncbi:MAG: polysaccharide deacetylase family protein [Opitutae bacterium]|jgi:peptidoglycan/xylan/chitin deacetylase (PgdA/CDA1 family)|nr:polysaccharide deacetylase family protein [Opitutae bacterium]